jgi:hypothetical protein
MKLLIVVMLSLVMVGCVETLEKSIPPVSDTQNPTPELINYSGVLKATSATGPGTRAISDTRIEVYFPPASGGSGKFVYDVYIGSNEKYSYSTESLERNKIGGYYVVTISDREIFSKNTVRVEVRDSLRFAQSDTKNSVEVTTFTNEVCQFDGISSVANLAGTSGKDALRIKWVPAIWTGVSAPSTPIFYEVTLIENGIERDRFHDPTLTEAQGRVVRSATFKDGVNETIVRGLKTNTRYDVTVRCIHFGSVKNEFLPQLYSEQNTKSIVMTTLDGNLANIDFDENTLGLSLLPGANGYTGIRAAWGLLSGAFDHFRVYFKKKAQSWPSDLITSDCSTDYTDEESISCKKVDYDQLTTTVTGLSPNTEYEAKFVICGENACNATNTQGGSGRVALDFPEAIKTTPALAGFEGIKTIALNTGLSELGSVNLGFVRPNLNSGYVEEYVVTVKRGASGVFTSLGDEALTVDPYVLETADKLVVRGLKFGEVNDYCFRIQVKIGNSSDTNGAQKCVNVSGNTALKISGASQESNINFLPPSSSTQPKEFAGLLNASIPQPSGAGQATETVRLTWLKPSAGFYLTYDFYVATDVFNANDLFVDTYKVNSFDAFYMDNFVRDVNSGEIRSEIQLPKGEKFSISLATGFPGLATERNSCVWYCCPKLNNNDATKTCDGTSSLPNPNFKCFTTCSEEIQVN